MNKAQAENNVGNLRVLLLNLPTAAESSEPLLNLGYLAGVLRLRGHDVRIVDATAPYNRKSQKEVREVIQEYRPHFIGITLTITYVPASYEFIKGLKDLNIPIVLGGPHPNACPKEALDNGGDIVCIGEGEETIVEIAEYFEGKRERNTINGICFKDEQDNIIFTPSRALINNLDSTPNPDFKDFPIRHYSGSDDPMSNPIFWSVFSSRGCPFDCIFCSSHNVFGRTMRIRSAKNVFEEIKGLVDTYKIQSVAFQDDEILCKKDRFLEFCDLIESTGLTLKMSIRTRIDSVEPEILKRAKAAGITRLSFGIESWDDETLLKINKKYDVKTIHKHIKYLSDAQPIYISFNNIIGFPWETRRHYSNIVQELKKIPKNIKYFTNTGNPIPYPKTKLYDDYKDAYGFADWWLDPDKHIKVEYANNKPPFFMNYASMFCTLYIKDPYWNYSRKQQAEIDWFSWTVFGLFLKNHLNSIDRLIVMALCRISHWIWWQNKELEYAIFSSLSTVPYFTKLKERVSFTNKY
jgi:anaerobic magnesium-protoporphyrin IX monomethyl ester cyclase